MNYRWLLNSLLFFSLGAENRPKLYDFAYNVNSQFGEDWVIQKIFEIIDIRSKVCIEFGAWDGFLFSNTAHLFSRQGWKAILIECFTDRYHELVRNTKQYDCIAINEMVTVENSLEKILDKYQIKDQIDLLSIDIDGNDYYIFEQLTIKPRVVIVEFNPTIPASVDMYQPYAEGIAMGCSVAALVRVARTKGYRLVALTDINAFFVTDEEFDKFALYETALERIRSDKYLRYIVTDYGGQYKVIAEPIHDPSYKLSIPLDISVLGSYTLISKKLV